MKTYYRPYQELQSQTKYKKSPRLHVYLSCLRLAIDHVVVYYCLVIVITCIAEHYFFLIQNSIWVGGGEGESSLSLTTLCFHKNCLLKHCCSNILENRQCFEIEKWLFRSPTTVCTKNNRSVCSKLCSHLVVNLYCLFFETEYKYYVVGRDI